VHPPCVWTVEFRGRHSGATTPTVLATPLAVTGWLETQEKETHQGQEDRPKKRRPISRPGRPTKSRAFGCCPHPGNAHSSPSCCGWLIQSVAAGCSELIPFSASVFLKLGPLGVCLTPDQKVGSSNLAALVVSLLRPGDWRGPLQPQALAQPPFRL